MWVNEKNYIKKLKGHNEKALEFIVDKYLPLVKGVTHKVLYSIKDDSLIEECINDVFLSIWNNSDKFIGGNDEFRKWICAIAKFKAIDYYRKAIKKAEVLLEEVELINGKSVEDEIIIMENQEELMNLINTLDQKDKEIVIKKFFLGQRSEEIALDLGISKAAVDNRIYRSKRKLRDKRIEFNLEVI